MKSKGKLILYWDYELQKGIDVSIQGNKSTGFEEYEQTKFILKLLKKYNIKTCFSILGCTAEKKCLPYSAPDQIKQMIRDGHEVGAHTYSHENISTLSYKELVDNLTRTKKQIESVTKTPCISFTPPWDKPQYLNLNLHGINISPDYRKFSFSKLSYKDICRALRETGYKTYRICPFSIYKSRLSKPKIYNGIVCIPSIINNGFTTNHRKLVRKACDSGGLAVVYAHPKDLARPGPQNKKHFITFIDYVSKLVRNKKLEVILPYTLYKV